MILARLSRSRRLSGLSRDAGALIVSTYFAQKGGPVVWVCDSNQEADDVAEDIPYFLPEGRRKEVMVFPGLETDPYRGISPHPELAARRAVGLARLLKGFGGVLIIPVAALAQRLVSPESFQRRCRKLATGDASSRDSLIAALRSMGYAREDPVGEIGEFSFRGGIVDVFSPSGEFPYRIEFFGDEVESIRQFDPSTQRSVGLVESCEVVPMRELCPSSAEIAVWHQAAPQHWREVRFAERLSELFQFTENGELFNGFESLFPLVLPLKSSILDYLASGGAAPVLFLSEPEALESVLQDRWRKAEESFQDSDLAGIPALQPSKHFFPPDYLTTLQQDELAFSIERLSTDGDDSGRFDFTPGMKYHGRIQELLGDVEKWRSNGERTVFVMHSAGMAERLVEIFREYDSSAVFADKGFDQALKYPVAVTIGRLHDGFASTQLGLRLVSETDVFGERRIQRTEPRRAEGVGIFLSDFRDLADGDYVVHLDHGIGIFRGLGRVGVGEQAGEFVILEYSGGSKLYVPTDRLDLIQKYCSGGGSAPQVDRLGGASWKKTKARIKKSMQDLAEDLLKLYAQREVAKGFAFSPDDELMKEFEAAFEYDETPDQLAAIQACKVDMEEVRPMDRLICGDVGYGKTEVAMRAAFKAVNDAKQVVVLAPTTVLAFQHYNTFRERFSGFPVQIEMLSRFVARPLHKEILQRVKSAQVDILIGTHRLLSRDLILNDLGLIIVDEEQRFGVAQKEKLKRLKANVDVLTLSATPIPRTLNMSLVGIRDLSIIETAPRDRLSIQTVVVRFSAHMIRNAIDMELKRSGQVFFVHNSVETIYGMASTIQKIAPEARLAVAHGQMREEELEQVMLDFLHYKFDVLVCTTIIENGLDIPRANTIIVNRADRFGLSQLYQLRGRVGRSNRRAYAYLLVAEEEALSEDARKRLAAIKEFSDLGSGFRLAALDMEIRGAGNLLGGEQSGHIDAVGFELYVKLLDQAIRELKGEPTAEEIRTAIDLRLDIRIPEHYIEDSNLRLWVYKRLSSLSDAAKVESLREEVTDRFGRYPRAVANLFDYARIRLKAQDLRLVSIERKGSQIRFKLRPDTPIPAEALVRIVTSRKGYSFATDGSLIVPIDESEHSSILETVNRMLDALAECCPVAGQ